MYNESGFKPKGRGGLPRELIQMGRHLVYSEGTRTEPYYVENIKSNIAKKYKKSPNDILLISYKGKSTLHTTDLVKFAFKDVKKKLDGGYTVNHVWILFDKDDFGGFEEAHEAIIAKNDSDGVNSDGFYFEKSTGICWHSCPSNQCFELWLLLYFSYYNVPNDRRSYIDSLENVRQLKKIGFKYAKNLESIHDILTRNGGSLENAVKNAKKLEKERGTGGDPSTKMYEFGEYFGKYTEK